MDILLLFLLFLSVNFWVKSYELVFIVHGLGGVDDCSWAKISDEIEWTFMDPNQQQNFMMDTLNNVTCCAQQLSNNI